MKAIQTAFLLLILTVFLCLSRPANAQSESPYDLIAEINALRASLGLEPYQVDSWIMAYAQDHADYIAET